MSNGNVLIFLNSSDEDQLDQILKWLKKQNNENITDSFYMHQNLIVDGWKEKKLFVLLYENQAVGYSLIDRYNLSLLEIQNDFRKKGFGKLLAQYTFDLLEKTGNIGIELEAVNDTDDFWKKMGCIIQNASRKKYIRYFCDKNKFPAYQNTGMISIEILNELETPIYKINKEAKKLGNKIILMDDFCYYRTEMDLMIEIKYNNKSVHKDFINSSNVKDLERVGPFVRIKEFPLS